nr:hypothetical protein [Candidatus Levybacteria bacterium]
MITITRSEKNPILKPNPQNLWELKAAFNPSIVKDGKDYHMVYRALSENQNIEEKNISLSTIGYAKSKDGVNFSEREQLIKPQEDWEKFGCEDPRITKIDDEYFVFYTALSDFPFLASSIKIGLALFKDFKTSPQKHLITPFNAKAMVLFPEKINGKYVALLTVNTDIPPSSVAIAWFDKKEDIWSKDYWRKWYLNLSKNTLPLRRINSDQLEIGAAPIFTPYGWLLIYSHIQHYYDEKYRLFGVEAVLLDHYDPQKILSRTDKPIIVASKDYEMIGNVNNVIFPSSALLQDDTVSLYYGASDTTSCLATFALKDLLENMNSHFPIALKVEKPLSEPLMISTSNPWESKAVFNPAAFYDGENVHLLYRAMDENNTSVLGYAKSPDGLSINKRLDKPIYVPRADFEDKKNPGGNSGCEDPRITVIGERMYVCYTAFDGVNPPRIVLTSIGINDFLKENFNWEKPVLISPPGIDDKDAAIFPEKINGKYVIIHRIQNSIVLDYVDSLDFDGNTWLRSIDFITPREDSWDSEKIGLCTPPLKTNQGWLVLYHGVSRISHEYRVGAMLLDLNNPSNVLSRTLWPILEPETRFEREGIVKNVVFPCGAVLIGDMIYIYYGGADKVVCVATISFSTLYKYLTSFGTY